VGTITGWGQDKKANREWADSPQPNEMTREEKKKGRRRPVRWWEGNGGRMSVKGKQKAAENHNADGHLWWVKQRSRRQTKPKKP